MEVALTTQNIQNILYFRGVRSHWGGEVAVYSGIVFFLQSIYDAALDF